MKILYILKSFSKLSETFVLNEIIELKDKDHDIFIVAFDNYSEFNQTSIDAIFYKDIGEEGIKKLIQEKNIEHIHCHFADINAQIAYKINKEIGIPYTITLHAYTIFKEPPENMQELLNNAKKIITISRYNKKYIVEHFEINPNHIEVIHCGINLNEFEPVKEKTNDFKVISVCRFVEKKGISHLIEACKEINCEIVGEGILKERYLEQIKDNNNIKIKEPIRHENIKEFMKTGSVFVLPCVIAENGDRDGIPVSLMEAMALEIPVISTNVSGIPELIDNRVNGILVEPNNSEQLREAIIKIKNDKEFREKIRKNSRKIIEEEFDIEKNVLKLVEVFEE